MPPTIKLCLLILSLAACSPTTREPVDCTDERNHSTVVVNRACAGLLALLLTLTACSGSLVSAQRDAYAERLNRHPDKIGYATSDRCHDLDDRHMWAGGIAFGGAVVTGASGVATLPVEELPENAQGPARYTAAGIALGAAATTAIASYIQGESAESFQRECQP